MKNTGMRPQYATNIAYQKPTWPSCDPTIEAAALTLLEPVLHQIGEHRKSTSKRSRGRNRPNKPAKDASPAADVESDVLNAVTVGLQSNWRKLEGQARGEATEDNPIAIVFCSRDAIPDPAADALLLLIAAASARPDTAPIRLVPISADTESKIAASLGMPRAALVGISEGNSRTAPLTQYVRETIAPLEAPWLRDRDLSMYVALQVETTLVPVKSNKREPVSTPKAKSGQV
ncbi:uncharacterized protein AB675_5213 [Cyphellophora attinorum]|uniref:Uncharacterized protein n=1 Tax=Cyphellophora attinorum TaxID=1664694 RepID=A0A0N1NZY6_9EURO|nr:uncharacterized protein AB675_5213 [Phialophora attinorum]KPI39383.1 hypothetical protein AB675_5213 [Phialophora attinorum]